jgi:hypothetical protein
VQLAFLVLFAGGGTRRRPDRDGKQRVEHSLSPEKLAQLQALIDVAGL